jgi:glycine/D-amino acid oxidase-like deaminating enzyme
VLACGASTRTFPAAGYLEIAAVHGQLDFVAAEAAPRLPLVGRGYLVPGGNGLLAVGSTYEYQPWDPHAASRANLAQLAGHRYRWRYRCRGTRSVSSDRTAVAGPLFDPDGRAVPDLYVTTGHGSAGNVSTHLAAALLTAHITGDCPPLQRCLEAALSPLRFRERQARRGYRHNARD